MLLKKFTSSLALALAMGFGMSAAQADIQISDTYIDFKGRSDFSVTLVNTGTSIDSYKVELLKWTQKSGYIKADGSVQAIENVYTISEGEGLSTFPNNMVLRQGQTNTLRLRVTKEEAKAQNAYKLVLREVDKKYPGNRASGSSSQIMLKFSHRIPVFLNENEKSIKQLNFEHKVVNKNGKNYLYIKNLDKQPLFLNEIKQDGLDLPAVGYVFTGIETYIDLQGVDLKKPISLKDRYTTKEIILK